MKKYLLFFLLVMMGNVWGQATLPFAYDGGNPIGVTGLTANGLGSNYSSSPKMKFDHAGDYLILNFSGNPGTLTFDIKWNKSTSATRFPGDFELLESANGSDYTRVQLYNSTTGTALPDGTVKNETFANLNSTSRYLKWIYTSKTNGNIALGNIALSAGASVVSPTVTTQSPTLITTTTATGHGNITATGGVNATDRGFCWDLATNQDPDVDDSKVTETGNFGTGAFTGNITGLTAGTNYKVRAYATNSEGTSYGDVVTFYTLSTEPSAYPSSFTASAFSQTQIDLAFSAASTITNAAGYVIMQKVGSAPTGLPSDANGYTVGNTIGDATVAAIITNTSSTSVSITGLTAGTQYYYAIIPYNWDGSTAATYNYKTDGTLTTANATTAEYSVVTNPETQVVSGSISSLFTDINQSIDVLKFKIEDKGGDSKNTIVTKIRIQPGNENQADWTNTIAGVRVKKGVDVVTIGTFEITDTYIDINIAASNLVITDNKTEEITFGIYLKNTGLINETYKLDFKVSSTSHGFTTDGSGTAFATAFASDVEGNSQTITVVATLLKFTENKPPATVNANTNFEVEVEAVDANGNRDLDATNSVTLTRSSGTGTLTSGSNLTKNLDNGLYSWSDIKYDKGGTFRITATASEFPPIESALITSSVNSSDLIISEYIEGSSNNKYVEIFNGTGNNVDLTGYKLRLFANGGSSTTSDVTLSGILLPNEVVVFKNTDAVLVLPNSVTALVNSVCNFNGDDAIALYKISSSSYVDIFGKIGEDPGTQWMSEGISTLDKTLRRKASIINGVTTNPSSGFPTLSTEWEQYNIDIASGLGSHSMSSMGLAGSSTKTVGTGNPVVSFENTSSRIQFTTVNTSKKVIVSKYDNKPENITGIEETNISEYRWVINTEDGFTFTSAELRFKRSELVGIDLPITGTIKLYKRSTPGSGAFELVGELSYDAVNDELYQTVTSFSEFVMASNNNPLPVELTSFTAKYLSSGVVLNWQTATEINNNKFEVERQINEGNWEVIGEVLGHGNSNTVIDYTYTDSKTSTKGKYNYRLKQIDNDGTFKYTQVVNVTVGNLDSYELAQNYPNPFNPSTNINFTMPKAGNVKIVLFNALGQEVATLFNGNKDAGFHTVQFNANGLPSGIYFYQMTSEGFNQVKKMILTK